MVVNRLYSETAASNLEAQGLDPDEYRAADADLIYEFHDQEILSLLSSLTRWAGSLYPSNSDSDRKMNEKTPNQMD